MRYFCTASWQSKEQPLIRCAENFDLELDNIRDLYAYEIVRKLVDQNRLYDKDYLCIDFLLPMGE